MCFLDSDAQESINSDTKIGGYNHQDHKWYIDQAQIIKNRGIVLTEDTYCKDCFAQSHCHRSCPDRCPITAPRELPDLHCKLNRQMFAAILEHEGKLLAEKCKKLHLPIAGKEIFAC